MRLLGSRIDLPQAAEKVGIVDGAPWIRLQVEAYCAPRTGRKKWLGEWGLR